MERQRNVNGAMSWTKAEDHVLRTMRSHGEGDAAIAAALGRTQGSVQSRAHQLRSSGVSIRKLAFWNDEQVATVIRMREAGDTVPVIAAAIGRSHWSVRERIKVLQADGTIPGGGGGVDRDHVRRIPMRDPLLLALHAELARRSA